MPQLRPGDITSPHYVPIATRRLQPSTCVLRAPYKSPLPSGNRHTAALPPFPLSSLTGSQPPRWEAVNCPPCFYIALTQITRAQIARIFATTHITVTSPLLPPPTQWLTLTALSMQGSQALVTSSMSILSVIQRAFPKGLRTWT